MVLFPTEWPFIPWYSHIHSKYEFWHDFAGKGVLNVLGRVPPKWFVPFYSYDSVALTLGCKLASFYHFIFAVLLLRYNFKCLFKRFWRRSRGHCRDIVIYGFENNSRRKWCSRGRTWNVEEHRSSKYFLGTPFPKRCQNKGNGNKLQ